MTIRQENALVGAYILGAAAVFALGLCLVIWPGWDGQEHRSRMLLIGGTAIFLVCLVAPVWIRKLIQHRKQGLHVYPEGFSFREAGTQKTFRWTEVGPFRLYAEDPDDVPSILFDLLVPEPPKTNGQFIEEPVQPMLPLWLDADAKDLNRFMNEYRNAALRQERGPAKSSDA